MIRTERIYKTYGNHPVIEDARLEIESGKMVAILGKSGAGKSTLLHMLGTLEKPDKGKIFIDGTDITTLKDKELARFRNSNIGFIFQFHYLLPEFSALENICIPAWIRASSSKKETIDKAMKLLKSLDMERYAHVKPSRLSGGEQQRVSIMRALINEPAFILADEPTGNLDTQTSNQFMELIVRLREEKPFTFVMVTHNETIAKQFDRQILINDGRISY